MKKISYVLAALATIAIAAPVAAEDKPMMRGGMHEGMHHHMDHRMDMHRHHHHHHTSRHVMRREGM
jgi:Ni/Co efflux regulator RcnB